MKKRIVFLMCLCMVVTSVRAFDADECAAAGGTEITRNVYGTTNAPSTCTPEKCPATTKTFCKSGQSMNWWSAFNWCKSIGGSLAKFSEMCPHTQTALNVEDTCPALKGLGTTTVWSSVGFGSTHALIVYLSSGAVNGSTANGKRYSTNYYALCE